MNQSMLLLQSVTALTNVFGDAYTSLTATERALLREDAEALRVELSDDAPFDMPEATPYDAAEVLKLRIGGAANLRCYVDCLVAGARRREWKGGRS